MNAMLSSTHLPCLITSFGDPCTHVRHLSLQWRNNINVVEVDLPPDTVSATAIDDALSTEFRRLQVGSSSNILEHVFDIPLHFGTLKGQSRPKQKLRSSNEKKKRAELFDKSYSQGTKRTALSPFASCVRCLTTLLPSQPKAARPPC